MSVSCKGEVSKFIIVKSKSNCFREKENYIHQS